MNGQRWVCLSPRSCVHLRSNHSGSWVLRENTEWVTVTGGPCISCISQVQDTQGLSCARCAQSQVGCVSPALPRSKLLIFLGVLWRPSPSWAMYLLLFPGRRSPDPTSPPSSLSGNSPRWVLRLLYFPGPSCSDSWLFYECPVPVEPCISCSSQAKVAWCSAWA